jgi:hypothetical protein
MNGNMANEEAFKCLDFQVRFSVAVFDWMEVM